MAKKTPKRKKQRPLPYWPGLTRMHDKAVGCGAVLLTDELAHALLAAVDIAATVLEETPTGRVNQDEVLLMRMASAKRILEWTYLEDK